MESKCDFQMKRLSSAGYFHIEVFIYDAVQGVSNFFKKPRKCVTIQKKAIEQYFHEVLFTVLYKVVLTFKSVDETLVCDVIYQTRESVSSHFQTPRRELKIRRAAEYF